jgi:hypothetical protein
MKKFFLPFLFLSVLAGADESTAPVVLSALPNLNDFHMLASGGDDQGWRVGYDTAWVIQLPPAPPGAWARAYVGAKLGRLKSAPVPGRPSWERRVPAGEVDVAVSQEPLWPHSRRLMLARAGDIPLEGEPGVALEGVGEARWFWAEIPLRLLSKDTPHFVTLFSPSVGLAGGRGPVLAGGMKRKDGKGANLWIKTNARGQPPAGIAEALKTPVSSFEPAVALMLVPHVDGGPHVVLTGGPEEGSSPRDPFMVSVSVEGADVSRAWLEASADGQPWAPVGRPLWGPPFTFTARPAQLPSGEVRLRVSASDRWETRGSSSETTVVISSGAAPILLK